MAETCLAIRRADRTGIELGDGFTADYIPLEPGQDAWTLAAALSDDDPVTFELVEVRTTVLDQRTIRRLPEVVNCPGQESLDLAEERAT